MFRVFPFSIEFASVPERGFEFGRIVFAEIANLLDHLSHLPERTAFPEVFGSFKPLAENTGCDFAVYICEPDKVLSASWTVGYMVGAFRTVCWHGITS